MTNDVYEVPVTCTNCTYGNGGFSTIKIPKGETLNKQLCPNCGCQELVKIQRATL